MSRFVTEIKGEAAMGRTDLNKAAETILIPLLNEIYGWNLENVNYTENDNNYPGIDLADKTARICVQVTATTGAEKVKHTLEQFVRHEQYLDYDRLVVFFLQEKKQSYPSKTIQKIAQNKFGFDIKKDILDYRALLREVSGFQIERVTKVREILEANFGDSQETEYYSNLNQIERSNITERFKEYVRLVCEDYQNYWQHYAFIDEIDDSTWFEFGLDTKVATQKQLENQSQQDDESKQTKRKPILQVIQELGEESLLIFGSSGSGKSTLLSKLFYESSLKAQKGEFNLVPVLIELKSYETAGEDSGLEGLVLNSLQSYDPNLEKEDLKQIRKEKRLALFIDGFNELPVEKAKPKIKQYCKSVLTVATSRNAEDWGELGQRLEIQSLTYDEVIDFFKERLPGTSQGELKELGNRVRDFGDTPLMVWMLYCIFNTNQEIPETRGEAYRRFTSLYLERSKEGINLPESRTLLGKLAFKMMQSVDTGNLTEFRLEISETDAKNILDSEQTIKLLRNCHLLKAYGKPGNRRIKFCHQSLQEYYAAEELLKIFQSQAPYGERGKYFQYLYLNHRKWTEPIALMASLLTDETLSLDLLRMALSIDWTLGARLSREVVFRFPKKAIELLIETVNLSEKSGVSSWLKSELLGITQSSLALPYLLVFLTDSNISVAQRAAFWIGHLPPNEAVPILVRAIKETEIWVLASENGGIPNIDMFGEEYQESSEYRMLSHKNLAFKASAILALSYIAEREAAKQLRDIFQDSCSTLYFFEQPQLKRLLAKLDPDFVVQEASRIIEDAEGRESSNQLNQALSLLAYVDDIDFDLSFIIGKVDREQDRVVKESLIDGLGEIAQIESAKALVKLIREGDQNTRKKSSNSLIRYSRKNAVPHLIEIVEDSSLEWERRWCASVILAKFGNPSAVITLIEALKDEERRTRIDATELLAFFQNKDVINALKDALQDPDYGVRRGAAVSLAQFGQKEAIPELFKALWHYVPKENGRRNVETTYNLLGAGNITIPGMTQENLSSLGDDEAVQAWIFEIQSVGAKEQAALALGNFDNDEVIDELRQAMHLGLKVAAIPLAKLGIEDGIPHLIEILKDITAFSYNRHGIEALLYLIGNGSTEIIEILISTLESIGEGGVPKDLRFLNRVATVLVNVEQESMPTYLPRLRKLLKSPISEQISQIIDAIQRRWGFYNYEITQLKLETISSHSLSSRGSIFHFHEPVCIVNTGSVTIHGDQK